MAFEKTFIMKKMLPICMAFGLPFVLSSCKEKVSIQTSFAIPENALTPEEAAIAQNEATSAKRSVASDGSAVDYDLSEMNSMSRENRDTLYSDSDTRYSLRRN